jgi:hypothetical protein
MLNLYGIVVVILKMATSRNFSMSGHNYHLNFKNGRHCHGNGQNAKKLKNTKMIIAGYSQNRN